MLCVSRGSFIVPYANDIVAGSATKGHGRSELTGWGAELGLLVPLAAGMRD